MDPNLLVMKEKALRNARPDPTQHREIHVGNPPRYRHRDPQDFACLQ